MTVDQALAEVHTFLRLGIPGQIVLNVSSGGRVCSVDINRTIRIAPDDPGAGKLVDRVLGKP